MLNLQFTSITSIIPRHNPGKYGEIRRFPPSEYS
jgi:hypothetical protein